MRFLIKGKSNISAYRWLIIVALMVLLAGASLTLANVDSFADAFGKAYAAEKQSFAGVDEVVIEKYAKEAGREASKPLINTDQGDMLLFIFLIAGAIGGFIIGYNYRKLFVENKIIDSSQLSKNYKLSQKAE